MSSRPDRSDAHLLPADAAKFESDAREFFDEIAPKRHTKPSRSEYSNVYKDELKQTSEQIPELHKFKELEEHNTEKFVCNGNEVIEEFVETEYYKDLNCVDKQHHTTGTGFIKMEESSNSTSFHLESSGCDASECHTCGKGNPATNEWIPAADNVIPSSHKPGRSDI